MTGVVEPARRAVRWIREHPFAADTTLAVLVAVPVLVAHLVSPEFEADLPVRDPAWWTVPLVLVAVAPIAYRRRRPFVALAAAVIAQVVCELVYVVGPGWITVLILVYSVGAHTDGRKRVRAMAVFGVVVVCFLLVGVLGDDVTIVDAVAALGVLTAGFVLGDNLRRRRLNLVTLAERAERAERERDLLARERVAEERNRIARELHDIVAHSVSVMVIQASAARRTMGSRPDDAATMLENVERTGRQTMDELRQVLGVLRDASGEPQAMPLPTLADLPSLVDGAGALGVRLAVTGVQDRVPAAVAVSVYRIVQEALTNANRHAGPGASVDVRVTCSATDVEIVVTDDGRGASTVQGPPGYGLVGMQERAAAAGGAFRAGPRPGGGWRVQAVLPFPTPLAPPAPETVVVPTAAPASTLAS